MDSITAEIKKCEEEIAKLEKALTESSFNLKVKKAQLKKWTSIKEQATELLQPLPAAK